MSQSGGDEGTKGSGSDDGGDGKGKSIAAAAADRGGDSSSSSSIGEQSSGDDDMAEEVQAPSKTTLDCLAALEDSLPMKRGLSGFYKGKSKSFANLTDLPLDDSDDLSKTEHPVNKKRRLLRAHEVFHDKKTGGSSSANVAPDLPPDDQTNDEAVDDVEESRGDDQNQDGDDK